MQRKPSARGLAWSRGRPQDGSVLGGGRYNVSSVVAVAVAVWGCASEPAPTPKQVEEEAWFPEPAEPSPEFAEAPANDPAPPPSTLVAAAVTPDVEAEDLDAAPPTEAAGDPPEPSKAAAAPPRDPPKPVPAVKADRPAAPSDPAPPKIAEEVDPEPPGSGSLPEEPSAPPTAHEPPAAPDPPPPAPKPKPTLAERMTGEFRYSGGAAQKERAAEAVESVVGQMSVLSRGIARKRLLESAKPVRSVELRLDGSDVTAVFDGRRYRAKLGGAAVEVTGVSGDALSFKVRKRKDQLMLAFSSDRGGKTYVLRVDDKDRLRMRVTIHSSSLPASVVYQLTYKRA